jgi:hypothetical protein
MTKTTYTYNSFPTMFAIWRPSYNRFHFYETVFNTNGSIRKFVLSHRPWTSVKLTRAPTAEGQRVAGSGSPLTRGSGPVTRTSLTDRSRATIHSRSVPFHRTADYFTVHELGDCVVDGNAHTEISVRRVPVIRMECHRSLPRSGI